MPEPLQDDQSLPVPEFSVRTGEPIGAPKQTVRAKTIEISDVKVAKGTWLRNKLSTLYNDPKYKTGTPEQQQQWKSLAYDKWLSPYYKNVLKIDPPKKEEWLTGQYSKTGFVQRSRAWGEKLDQEILGHSLKATSDITAGLLHNVADAVESIDKAFGETPQGQQRAQSVRSLGDKYTEYGKVSEQYLESVHNKPHGEKPRFSEDIPGKVSELGTQAIFFEATGAGKLVKILNVANPKTAALAVQMAKASYNGAVDYGLWSASQGEKAGDIEASVAAGAVLGPVAKVGQRKLFDPLKESFKSLFKWGGKEAVEQVLSETVEKASMSQKEQVQIWAKNSTLTPEGQKLVGVAAQKLNEYAQEKFKKNYVELPYIQKINILNKALATVSEAASSAKSEGMPKQLVQAQAKEQDELMATIFPEAKASQDKIEQFIKQNGEAPVQTKLLASLPHHNTTVDSSWKHLQARASFLKSRLRDAKGEEKQAIQQALNEEYSLMKEKKAKQKIQGTVGGAAANDPRIFRDDYVVTPNVDPYNHGFTDWYDDSFAKGVARSAKEQALVKGQTTSYLANAIDNSFLVGSNLAKQTRLGEGTTKQLFHPQFGMVGGINYIIVKASSIGENSGLKASENVMYINYLGMRPNVVARVWPVKGGGQTLFLNAAMEAQSKDMGIALIPFDESKSFYEKMGMQEAGSYMVMNKDQVKKLLQDKGLLMMLLGAGITYGADKVLSEGDYSVRGQN
jgi:hypothetical protein